MHHMCVCGVNKKSYHTRTHEPSFRYTDQSRRTINLNFLRSYLKTQHNQFIQISRQRILEYPKQLQRLLGYHSAFGIVGMADYQDPLKYLQKIVKHGDGKQYKFGMDYVVFLNSYVKNSN